MGLVTLTAHSAGQVLTAAALNNNFNAIVNQLNGSVEAVNIASLAVTTAKIATGAVTGPKIAMGSDAQGDILYHNGTNYARLGAGTAGQVLTTGGASANPAWAGMTTQGDVEYHNGTTRTRLAAGTNGQFLMTGGAGANPSWVSGAYCAIGSYTGNGADDRNITVGFANTSITPKAVLILDSGGSNDCWAATSGMGGTARKFSTNAAAASDVIQAFSANTFQLGAGDANAGGVTYYFIAWG